MHSKSFPPLQLNDLSRSSASNFISLARTLRSRSCTLVAGAGVSTSAGFPTWPQLMKNIASIYFTHWQFDQLHCRKNSSSPPKNLSIAFCESYTWTPSAESFAAKLVDAHDALSVAQMILARVATNNRQYLIRKALYGDRRDVAPSDLMTAIADLCATNPISAIVSYNYDDVLERALRNRAVEVRPIWDESITPGQGVLPVFYPHGYLKEGGGPLVPIVLAEDDYHAYATDAYGWRNLIQLRQFSNSSCVFVGFSMTDPQVRRLLWVAKRGGAEDHFAFLPTYSREDTKFEMMDSLVDAQLSDLGVRVIRYPVAPSPDRHRRLVTLIGELALATGDADALWR